MKKTLPEIIVSGSNNSQSKRISHLLKNGSIRKLVQKVYTSNFSDDDATIIIRNKWEILGHLFSGATLSHRSALEWSETSSGHIFLTYKYNRIVTFPGLTVHLLSGPEATDHDQCLPTGICISSQPRAFLENLQPSKERQGVKKTLERSEVENYLDQICRVKGEDALNELRDEASIQAAELDMEEQFAILTSMISAILSTRPADDLQSPVTKARSKGQPYDPLRVELFGILFTELGRSILPEVISTQSTDQESQLFAFFDAYFSNYIEGTIFELDEAREIVFSNHEPYQRPGDAHDIRGTYWIVSNPDEMILKSPDYDSYERLLKARHLAIMGMRPDKSPGQFKMKPNQAGSTHFVTPELVKGTLIKGWEMHSGLPNAIAKAIFQMFLVSEIHPFDDGNGRIARIMMNAELEKAGHQKILIPTVYRENYLLALRALSRNKNPRPLIECLMKAQLFSSQIKYNNWDQTVTDLTKCNAFKEPDEDRLRLPSEVFDN
ncbi:MAG: Fic family protein [Candidatus Marinimicrobia bacterium]|nr:Fic family protein [Candidatus Neomarinimicrobiota bacterium]MCF7904287.1 Fic family protein [Candidatus Neomarinimicrobiota bacterium]